MAAFRRSPVQSSTFVWDGLGSGARFTVPSETSPFTAKSGNDDAVTPSHTRVQSTVPSVSSAPSVCVAASCRSDVPSAITSAVSASVAGVAGMPESHAGGVAEPEPLFIHFLRR